MTLALLTHGYVCPPSDPIPPGTEVGAGPTIVAITEVKPTVKHGRQTAPRIIIGVPEEE